MLRFLPILSLFWLILSGSSIVLANPTHCCKTKETSFVKKLNTCSTAQLAVPGECTPIDAIFDIAKAIGTNVNGENCNGFLIRGKDGKPIKGAPTGAGKVCTEGSSSYCCFGDGTCADQGVFGAGLNLDPNCITRSMASPTIEATCEILGLTPCTICTDGGASCHMDPHFVTWPQKANNGKGIKFDFHGQCDLVFATAPKFADGIGMSIQIRTTKRYRYSYIEAAALQIGNDILQVASFGTYMLNGVLMAKMPNIMATKYPVSHTQPTDKQHLFEVELAPNERIVIGVFKDMVSVTFQNATSYYFGDSLGMMGHFETGEMRARDGTTIISDPDLFGQEWQVLESEKSLFNVKDRHPQHPALCMMPDASSSSTTRRLGASIAKRAAEEACAHLHEDHQDSCVYDVMATGDIEMAQAVVF